jgi:Protein of unknown function (DUF3551)
MRIFLFILGVFAAIVCFKARCGRWSVVRRLRWGEGGGATNCGFSTYQQCLATSAGAGASCEPNTMYQGVSGPAPARHVRRHSKNFG